MDVLNSPHHGNRCGLNQLPFNHKIKHFSMLIERQLKLGVSQQIPSKNIFSKNNDLKKSLFHVSTS